MTKLTSQEIVDLNKEYTFFSWSVQGQVNPIPVTRAEGVYFWDADDKRYIDFSSQLMNTNIGHQHPKVVKAIQDQAAQLTFTKLPSLLGLLKWMAPAITSFPVPVSPVIRMVVLLAATFFTMPSTFFIWGLSPTISSKRHGVSSLLYSTSV